MKFRVLPVDSPILGLNECGEDMMLVIGFVGSVEYDRADSEELASLLEQAAALVRKQA